MKTVQYHTNEGFRSGVLVSTGRKFHRLILVDNPIRVIKVPLSEERYFTELQYKGQPYPLRRALNKIRKCAIEWHGGVRNISKEARSVLKCQQG